MNKIQVVQHSYLQPYCLVCNQINLGFSLLILKYFFQNLRRNYFFSSFYILIGQFLKAVTPNFAQFFGGKFLSHATFNI